MNARKRAEQKENKKKKLIERRWNVYVYNLIDWANEILILTTNESQRNIIMTLKWQNNDVLIKCKLNESSIIKTC